MVSEPLSFQDKSPDRPGWWLLRELDFVALWMFPNVPTELANGVQCRFLGPVTDDHPFLNRVLTIYVIFDHPRDYPDLYVLRRQFSVDGDLIHDCTWIRGSKQVQPLLDEMPPDLMSVIDPKDDPVIWGVWI